MRGATVVIVNPFALSAEKRVYQPLVREFCGKFSRSGSWIDGHALLEASLGARTPRKTRRYFRKRESLLGAFIHPG